MIYLFLAKKINEQVAFSFIQEEEHNIDKQSYRLLLEEFQSANSVNTSNHKTAGVRNGMNDVDMNSAFVRQINVWLPIILGFILYFIIYEMINMPIQKNSILYAKYGTNKAEKMGGR